MIAELNCQRISRAKRPERLSINSSAPACWRRSAPTARSRSGDAMTTVDRWHCASPRTRRLPQQSTASAFIPFIRSGARSCGHRAGYSVRHRRACGRSTSSCRNALAPLSVAGYLRMVARAGDAAGFPSLSTATCFATAPGTTVRYTALAPDRFKGFRKD